MHVGERTPSIERPHHNAARYVRSVESPGHTVRLGRIFRSDGRAVIIPFDHGMNKGPVGPLRSPRSIALNAVNGGADAMLFHAGLAPVLSDLYGHRVAGIVKLTDGITTASDQVVVATVEQAVRCAADAVCVEFYLGSPTERESIQTIGRTRREAEACGLPLMVSAYVHPSAAAAEGKAVLTAHAVRVASELGADFVKTPFVDDGEGFRLVVEGATVPVVVAGGRSREPGVILTVVQQALGLGAAGVAIGRNAWGAEDPVATIRAIEALVHSDCRSDRPN
jgi:fructose-bisphosphate aldolase / 2-amino-3,7-dideoxy-D-threo-hept-6-ulosonate synthase